LTFGDGGVTSVALVTDASRGIGFEVCRQLAGMGMTVILTARDPDRAEGAAEALSAEGLDVGARPIPEGAASVVRAATLPGDGPTGGFFRNGEPLPW